MTKENQAQPTESKRPEAAYKAFLRELGVKSAYVKYRKPKNFSAVYNSGDDYESDEILIDEIPSQIPIEPIDVSFKLDKDETKGAENLHYDLDLLQRTINVIEGGNDGFYTIDTRRKLEITVAELEAEAEKVRRLRSVHERVIEAAGRHGFKPSPAARFQYKLN